ncbi:hypothetical protein QBC46DRAFT_63094 [Diplogelasinospora grovesii]|uniref:R3H domain-containing protein n=1 Tax=Diplogelasinospora grovesii TaxID=303347 RepID=A0AAN6NKZ4_9PEZI|nr:hypothetical protein QBC46DRAFT_63094 [Diplogelasinospora grovesii]
MAAVPIMAHNDVKKLSFAKVAASSTSKGAPTVTTVARANAPTSAHAKNRREQNPQTPATVPAVPVAMPIPRGITPAASVGVADSARAVGKTAKVDLPSEDKVVEGLKELKLETKTPNLVVNGSSSGTERSSKTGNSQTPSDDNSQRADSGSELGTKPPSLDGKSITSGTTFALDEKESLRPDDSASVKAAAEDDDAFSVRGSYMNGSRMGSEVAARIHRIQIGDMPPRTVTTHVMIGNQIQGIATPQSGISEKQPTVEAKLPLANGAVAPDPTLGFLSKNPDEKLIEAMQSAKDRIFLLRLEQQVIDFVQDSKEPFMDLPPSNSFCRMLTHKLADYYHMTHSFEAVAGAVRIYRTPFCRIPPSLSTIAVPIPSSSSPAPAVLPRKIMRRGEDGELATNSASPSKPTSEVGSDSKDKTQTKEKLTREEREEAYNKARLRIFGSVENTETSTPEGEESNGVSRASSVSAKDRANTGARRKGGKQRRDDSESFDSRSQYIVYCGPQQTTWAPATAQYFPMNNTQFNSQFQQPYPNVLQSYGPNQSYTPMMPGNINNGFVPPYNGVPTYSPQPQAQPVPQPTPPQQQRYQPPNPPPPMAAPYSAPVPSVPQPAWPQQGYTNQNAYPPPRGSPAPPPAGLPTAGIPYAYGQLPVNVNPNDPKSQHPIPGSYSRPSFNPKTQSFVPSASMGVPMQPAPGPFGGSNHGSPQLNVPHLSYNGYQQQATPQPGGYGPPPPGPASSYGMARQGSNNSLPPYHSVQNSVRNSVHHGPPIGLLHGMPANNPLPPRKPNKPPTGPSGGSGGQQTFSHLPNYGNPALLPQKPTI